MNWVSITVSYLVVALCVNFTAFGGDANEDTRPAITITSVPATAPGESLAPDPIIGIVTGVKSNEYKVIVYAYGGDRWYVQPNLEASDIIFDADGKWETETHGGLQFAALLVKSSFKPRATLETISQVGGDIIAVAKKKIAK